MEAFRLPIRQSKAARRIYQSSLCSQCSQTRRLQSTQSSPSPFGELEENASLLFDVKPADPSTYDPVGKAKERKYQLPPSRYRPIISRIPFPPNSHLPDTNTALPATTAAPSTLTNRLPPTTQLPANSFPAHSPTHAYNRPTNASSPPTS
jgi:hypothetical protein